jgi:hypothetical protein
MHKARAFFFVCAGLFLLALWVPMALAGGVNINWGSGCWSDGTPLNDLAWSCDQNSGSMTMTLSFSLTHDLLNFNYMYLHLMGMTEAPDVPAWWQMGAGGCRSDAISVLEDFRNAPQVGCTNMWQNLASGSLRIDLPQSSRELTHILIQYDADQPSPLTAGVEYYAAQVVITYVRTVGSGSCSGCSTPMIWGFTSMLALEKGEGSGAGEGAGGPLPGGNEWTCPASVEGGYLRCSRASAERAFRAHSPRPGSHADSRSRLCGHLAKPLSRVKVENASSCLLSYSIGEW